ncbi:MAG: hypothetical protein H0V22_10515, partial [Solirubrobacterales bacterium]|nr:hypothetical protein [Solirubrobacterales bacterium]
RPGDRGAQVIARARVQLSATAPPTSRSPDDVAAVALDGAAPDPPPTGLIEPPEFEPEALGTERAGPER